MNALRGTYNINANEPDDVEWLRDQLYPSMTVSQVHYLTNQAIRLDLLITRLLVDNGFPKQLVHYDCFLRVIGGSDRGRRVIFHQVISRVALVELHALDHNLWHRYIYIRQRLLQCFAVPNDEM